MKRSIKDYIIISLKGIAMGAADVVPGVSGGTIAFISGIYEELLNSIKSINLIAFKQLVSFKIKDFWNTINANFLIALVIGVLISIFSLAKILRTLLETHPIFIWSFFFGLIIASAIYVARTITQWNVPTAIALISGSIVAYFITVISPAEANTSYWFIFVSGSIAICAMILPGISGSFILVLLGMYKFILGAVSSFDLIVIAVFALGAIVGIISFSNLLSWLLKNFKNITIAVLAGFMIGSLNKVWPWKKVIEWKINRHGEKVPFIENNVLPDTFANLSQNQFVGDSNDPQLAYAIILAIIGFGIIFLFEVISKKMIKGNEKVNL